MDWPEENPLVVDAERNHHNTSDHSHEKALVFPDSVSTTALYTPIWRPLAHPLVRGQISKRIDRPPMT
jgi:hypothetical protein